MQYVEQLGRSRVIYETRISVTKSTQIIPVSIVNLIVHLPFAWYKRSSATTIYFYVAGQLVYVSSARATS